jgi:hypothetical protein
MWLNSNSLGKIDVKISLESLLDFENGSVGTVYIAFEDPDDALIFKIKYSI